MYNTKFEGDGNSPWDRENVVTVEKTGEKFLFYKCRYGKINSKILRYVTLLLQLNSYRTRSTELGTGGL